MPVFDGLLPDKHNNDIQSLLFTTAEWHTLAKMRLHTDSTLAWLDESTKAFGKQIRRFQSHTCSFFDTRELPQEEAARSRRQKKKKGSINLPNPSPPAPAPSTATSSSSAGTKKKLFNLILIKLHALGDYVKTIKAFGTTDSYSTQPVWMLLLYLLLVLIKTKGELEHRRVKRFYARTNKNNAVRQMTRLERREQALHRLILLNKDKTEFQTERSGHKKRKVMVEKVMSRPTIPFTLSEALPYTPPEYHHHISPSRNFPIHIHTFLNSTRVDDPAVVVSLIMLIKETY
jgi:hypothetical protein